MGMMLPNELIWVMEKLGFEWPDVDEDELRRGGDIVNTFRGEFEGAVQAIDRKINGDLAAAMRGQAGPAFVSAWNTNRSQNLQKIIDVLGPVPVAIDVRVRAEFDRHRQSDRSADRRPVRTEHHGELTWPAKQTRSARSPGALSKTSATR